MSRIAGLLTDFPESRATPLLDSMLKHFSRTGMNVRRSTAERCKLGATFINCNQKILARRGHYVAIIDGCIFEAKGADVLEKEPVDLVLDLFERYGFKEALSRINGDFAIALYDSNKNVLWLGRDRVGVRPLYYTAGQGLFAFASQPGALLRLPNVSRNLNRRFVGLFAGSHYRTFDNAQDESPFEAVRQLPAAHIAEIRLGKAPLLSVYWKLIESPDFYAPQSELAYQYKELLLDAVRLRIRRSISPAFLLSGGMDSSSVLASAVNILGEKQHAFSSVYNDKTYDESEEISSMLDGSVKLWNPIKISGHDLFSSIKKMISVHDEPIATATWLSHFQICERVARAGFKSLFGGLGGDELNAGEYEHFFYHFADLRFSKDEATLNNEINCWIRYHDHPIFQKNTAVAETALRTTVDLDNPGLCLPDRERINSYARAINTEYFNIDSFVPVMDAPFKSYLKNRTYQDLFRETAPCCLRAEDRQSNAYGLTQLNPFFDYRLIEFMFRVPGNMKIRDGVTKHLLREATKGLLPDTTRLRVKKSGWNAPAHTWFSGSNMDELNDLINSRAFYERGIYNIKVVKDIVIEHEHSLKNNLSRGTHPMFLWQLVNLELWQKSLDAAKEDLSA